MTSRPSCLVVTVAAAGDPGLPEVRAAVAAAAGRARIEVTHRVLAPGEADVADLARNASHDWLFLVPPHHRLRPSALEVVAGLPAGTTGVYGDLLEIGPGGVPADVRGQPAWAPEWWRTADPAAGCAVFAMPEVPQLVGGTPLAPGAEAYDLGLRAIEAGAALGHVPAILSECAAGAGAPTEAHVAALGQHLLRCAIDADVEREADVVRVRRRSGAAVPVSVIIPTRGGTGRVWGQDRVFVLDAVRSLAERSTHRATEVVVVADTATPPHVVEQLRAVRQVPVRIVEWPHAFHFSGKINAGCAAAEGDLFLLLNDDTELSAPGSLGEMAAYFTDGVDGGRPVGMVGAQLRYDDGTLQHAGHVYHEHVLHAFPGWAPGSHRVLRHPRECSGVTAAAAMVDRATFTAAGGFPLDFPLDFNDVDFSLSVRALGRRVLWTPHAEWFHFEGRSRQRGPRMDEFEQLIARWGHEITHDPYYHPHLETRRADWMPEPGWASPGWPARRGAPLALRWDRSQEGEP